MFCVFCWVTDAAAHESNTEARLAQSAERKALNLVVVGSSPTVGALNLCARASDAFGSSTNMLDESQ